MAEAGAPEPEEDKRPKREIAEERKEDLGANVMQTLETARRQLSQTGNPLVGHLFQFLGASHEDVFSPHGNPYNYGEQHAVDTLVRFLAFPSTEGQETEDWPGQEARPLPSGRWVRKQDQRTECLVLVSNGKREDSPELDGRLRTLGVKESLRPVVRGFYTRGRGAQVIVYHRGCGVIFAAGMDRTGQRLEFSQLYSDHPDQPLAIKVENIPPDPATGEKVDPIKCLARLFTA